MNVQVIEFQWQIGYMINTSRGHLCDILAPSLYYYAFAPQKFSKAELENNGLNFLDGILTLLGDYY